MITAITAFLSTKGGAYVAGILSIIGGLFVAWKVAKSKGRNEAFRATAEATEKLIRKSFEDYEKTRAKWDVVKNGIIHGNADMRSSLWQAHRRREASTADVRKLDKDSES